MELSTRPAKFNACMVFGDLKADVGDVGDIPEVTKRPGEVVFDYAVERG